MGTSEVTILFANYITSILPNNNNYKTTMTKVIFVEADMLIFVPGYISVECVQFIAEKKQESEKEGGHDLVMRSTAIVLLP